MTRRHHERSTMGARVAVQCVLLALLAAIAAAEERRDAPDLIRALESSGYTSREWTLLCAWEEATRDGQGATVWGCHLGAADGSQTQDVYLDKSGRLLSPDTLEALGVLPKNWFPPPLIQEAETASAPASVAATMTAPVPFSATETAGPTALVALPPINTEKALIEDASGESTLEKGAMRIGMFQDFEQPIRVTEAAASHGRWESQPGGGRLWAVTVYSPDAVALRVHFNRITLPEGARAVVYNMADPGEAYGPYSTPPGAEPDLWSATCFSDAVTIECYVPPQADGAFQLEIDRVIHVYRAFDEWFPPKSAAGSCNLDVACYPEWSGPALAVGGIGTVNPTGYLWCTGSLIADTNPVTAVPYFWTANHCVEDQAAASSIEVYWQYQRDACDGAVPSPRNVPRTVGGADYLVGAPYPTGADFTLLQLRNNPPEGLACLGWSSEATLAGTEATCIHHPSGDYKRISFGTLTRERDPCFASPPSASLFHRVLWDEGTTEGGSSGSPLMDTSTQLLVGQLYGGFASCTNTECPDYFGRFDKAFPIVQPWLAPEHDPLDVDYSGTVDSGDIQKVVNAALGSDITPFQGDLDGSGRVDAVDVQLIVIGALNQP